MASNNPFESIVSNTYDYNSKIKNPSQMGMSDEGTMSALTNDIVGIMNYTDLLMYGDSNASTTGLPLGNRYFLNTGTTCKDNVSGKMVSRSVLIDNVPSGDMSMPNMDNVLSSTKIKTSFKGLIPGIMEDITKINPASLLSSITNTDNNCREVYMKTIKETSPTTQTTEINNAYLLDNDIKSLDSCLFSNSINPITNQGCIESFTNYNSDNYNKSIISKLYIISVNLLFFYLLLKIIKK